MDVIGVVLRWRGGDHAAHEFDCGLGTHAAEHTDDRMIETGGSHPLISQVSGEPRPTGPLLECALLGTLAVTTRNTARQALPGTGCVCEILVSGAA